MREGGRCKSKYKWILDQPSKLLALVESFSYKRGDNIFHKNLHTFIRFSSLRIIIGQGHFK